MTSTQKTLGILLIVQIALILLLRAPFGDASTTRAPAALFPGLADDEISRIRLSGGEEALTLSRGDRGWQLDEFGGFPADESRVDKLVEDLAALEVRRPVVRSGKYHAAFDVEDDDHEGRVRVWSKEDGDPVADLIVGNSASYRHLRVRRAGDREVYEVEGLAAHTVRAEAGAWIEKKLTRAAADDVREISITNPSGSFSLVKGESGWSVAGRDGATVDEDKVASMLRTVTGLSMADPLGPSDEHGPAASDTVATVTIGWSETESEVETQRRAVIVIGDPRPDDDSLRVVKVEGAGFSGTIWDSSVRSLLEKKLADLLAG